MPETRSAEDDLLPALVYQLFSPAVLGSILVNLMDQKAWEIPGQASPDYRIPVFITRLLIGIIFGMSWAYHFLQWKKRPGKATLLLAADRNFIIGIDALAAILFWCASSFAGSPTYPFLTSLLMAIVGLLYLMAQLRTYFSQPVVDAAGALQIRDQSPLLGVGVAFMSVVILGLGSRSNLGPMADVVGLAAVAALYLMYASIWFGNTAEGHDAEH